ncbi:sigma factor-like helix-turn-helix DNA-binding protein [Pedobacter panaciterrae]|uniref:sigma factor-like helix-turn-helix DNA-binding protein n=1 Tax=Pedobacter panaciterrae TaxID=363849 RepID=UPI003741ED1F
MEFSLPNDENSLIFIKYFEDYTHQEIASSLNLPINIVKERLRKSRRRLRINYRLFTRWFNASLKCGNIHSPGAQISSPESGL